MASYWGARDEDRLTAHAQAGWMYYNAMIAGARKFRVEYLGTNAGANDYRVRSVVSQRGVGRNVCG
jgi:hypothetical protein